METHETVIVAMSGGVDSSVAAALLLKAGFRVIGATLRLRPCDDDGEVSWCCGRDAEEQSRRVADVLGIPHYVVDAAEAFEASVLRPAWSAYDSGLTPSPCILCNEKIKFQLLLAFGQKLGASRVATGHYARRLSAEDGVVRLLRGRDPNKDQSYFLFSLTEAHLEAALFPLGTLEKSEVRALAGEMSFPNAKRKESQDACFVYRNEAGFAEALRMRFGADAKPGDVLDDSGAVLGTHPGIHRFTVGQRKGLGIATGRRAYVSRIDPETRSVVLSDSVDTLFSKCLVAHGFVWTGGCAPARLPLRCQAQIRYRHRPAWGIADTSDDGRLIFRFDTPQKAVAPGQAVVLYDGDRVMGGAWIDEGHPADTGFGRPDKEGQSER
jgi:tRNA-uridine 2-sulfurtransferase